MKTVHPSDMVAHLWAHKSQPEARNARKTFFFEGDTIYSYGYHFPIARHASAAQPHTVLMTTRKYSVTTAKHISIVHSAVRHLNVIPCFNPAADYPHEHKENLRIMREDLSATLENAMKARVYSQQYIHHADELVIHHATYRRIFGIDLDKPLTIPDDWKEKAQERVKIQAEHAKEEKKRAAFRAEQARQEELKDLEEWKTSNTIRHSFYNVPIALRLANDREHVETSRGAVIPVTHAKRLWGKVLAVKASGKPYYQNGHTEWAGTFAVQSIETNGTLIAGCHTITFEAMQEFAGKMGW